MEDDVSHHYCSHFELPTFRFGRPHSSPPFLRCFLGLPHLQSVSPQSVMQPFTCHRKGKHPERSMDPTRWGFLLAKRKGGFRKKNPGQNFRPKKQNFELKGIPSTLSSVFGGKRGRIFFPVAQIKVYLLERNIWKTTPCLKLEIHAFHVLCAPFPRRTSFVKTLFLW